MRSELGDDVWPPRGHISVSNREDVRVGQPSQNLGFNPRAAAADERQQLEGDDVALVRVDDFVHLTLPAKAELPSDGIAVGDERSGHKRTVLSAAEVNDVRVAGIAVDVPTPGRPAGRLVVVDDASGSPTIETVIDFPADDSEMPVLLHDAAEAVRSRLESLAVDRVVVRRADWFGKAGNADGSKFRLLMEGALTSAAQSVVVDTRLGTGKDSGSWFGSSKVDVDAEATALLKGASHPSRYREATSAALAGLALGP